MAGSEGRVCAAAAAWVDAHERLGPSTAYTISVSAFQSAPPGVTCVDVVYTGAGEDEAVDAATAVRLSRLLEIDDATAVVVTELAARRSEEVEATRALVRAQEEGKALRMAAAASSVFGSDDDDDDDVLAGSSAAIGAAGGGGGGGGGGGIGGGGGVAGVDDELAAVVKERSIEYYLARASELLADDGGDAAAATGAPPTSEAVLAGSASVSASDVGDVSDVGDASDVEDDSLDS